MTLIFYIRFLSLVVQFYVVLECNSHLTPFPFYPNRLSNSCIEANIRTALDAILD